MVRLAYVLMIAALLVVTAPRPAEANGRFPQAMSCTTHPTDDQFLMLGVTFGLLLSSDGGQSWKWVCEESIGYGGTYDPDYAIGADGTLYVTTFDGLRVSTNGGCQWDLVGGAIADHWVGDVEIGPDGTVWAATSSGGVANLVATSTDGTSFTATALTHQLAWFKSVRIAPTDGQRVYVSAYLTSQPLGGDAGVSDPEALLYRSDDGGQSWTELDVGDFTFGSLPELVIQAVHPDDPDTVYGTAVSANPPLGDALYRSEDAGETWAKILDTDDPIQAVEFVSSGDLWVGTVADGVRILAGGRGDVWTNPDYQPLMTCLCENGDGLLSCGANWEPDYFAFARSTDGGDEWTKLIRFSEIDGPLECDPGTIQFDTCESKLWPPLCQQFGCDKDGDGGTTDAGVDAGTATCPDGDDCDEDTCLGCNAGGSIALSFLVIPFLYWRRRRD
jgi:photosystem II stability/assembly factor-like uncharacterized protein